jgi:5-methyltetrahydropteroyltriglutamate--homocysteine methyltransferase
MKRSTERMLTTHVGSLPRPKKLLELMLAKDAGGTFDPAALAAQVEDAVGDIVRRQVAAGIDVVDDGEQGKASFITYINGRLGGFELGGVRGNVWKDSREGRAFPEFYAAAAALGNTSPTRPNQMVCRGPVTYTGHAQLGDEIATFKAALAASGAVEGFMPSISPSNVENWNLNEYYANSDEFLFAIAGAMNEEYRTIVDAGLLLQVDDPLLATWYARMPGISIDDCRRWAERRVEAVNHALRGIPEERVRFHTCYSVNMGPRTTDMELKDFVDIMLKVKAGAYSFEAANPRHEHEWRVWKDVRLPAGKAIIPGVISHTTVLVEHPELVADRIERFAEAVGRESVIAGADCGFSSFATSTEMHPSVVWAKLGSLVEGARLASRRLWR